jgi:aspartyl-tRNA(Asn)/glutamyl-tRNA(Gln) amidotransferase subunit A
VIETAGIRTTAHSRVLKDNIPKRDATVYRKLRENGAILLGKTATHEFAHGGPSFDLPWPPARNPWSTERFTGGSSSGSAAAVAANLATAAIGTDTGGSIRIPAALCGVTGFKPTYGLVSRAGIVPNSYKFDHCGPIAWTAEDCAHVLQAIAGYDCRDSASAPFEPPDYAAALAGDLRVRIGVVRHFWEEDLPVSPVVASALESVCRVLRELGAQLETVRVRPLHEYTDVKNLISGVELHAAHQRLLAAHTAEFGAIMRQRILGFCALRAADYVRAERQRRRLVREMQPIFDEYDLLLTAAPGPAPPLAQHRAIGLDDKREKPKFTAFASVTGGPALVACCGFDADRLPLAFEISGAPFQDAVALRAGHAYQQVTGMPSTRPHLDHRAAPRAIAAADEPTPGAIEEPLAMHLDRLAEYAGFRFTASQRAEFMNRLCMHWRSRSVSPRLRRTARKAVRVNTRRANSSHGASIRNHSMTRFKQRAAVIGMLACLVSGSAWSASYPTKPVRMIVPFAPGGGTDVVGRLIGQRLENAWGVPVVIDNRPGAGSTVGTGMTAKATPDGYNLGVTSMSLAINATLYRSLPYDALKDLTPIILAARAPNVLVVNPSVPAHTVKELIVYAKAHPGKLNFSSSGTGGVSHLSAEVFRAAAGIEMVHVPYRGAGPAMTALIAGEAQVMMATTPVALPQMKAKRLRAIAISSRSRSPLAPDLPTIAENGFPGFETDTWYGLIGPAGMPSAIVKQINADAARLLDTPDMKTALAQQGAQPAGGSPEDFRRFIASEIEKWGKAIRAANVPPAN